MYGSKEQQQRQEKIGMQLGTLIKHFTHKGVSFSSTCTITAVHAQAQRRDKTTMKIADAQKGNPVLGTRSAWLVLLVEVVLLVVLLLLVVVAVLLVVVVVAVLVFVLKRYGLLAVSTEQRLWNFSTNADNSLNSATCNIMPAGPTTGRS